MTCFGIGIVLSVSAANHKEDISVPKKEMENPLDILHEAIG
jgi:hypothetical protein